MDHGNVISGRSKACPGIESIDEDSPLMIRGTSMRYKYDNDFTTR
jgi:hypothetical protein